MSSITYMILHRIAQRGSLLKLFLSSTQKKSSPTVKTFKITFKLINHLPENNSSTVYLSHLYTQTRFIRKTKLLRELTSQINDVCYPFEFHLTKTQTQLWTTWFSRLNKEKPIDSTSFRIKRILRQCCRRRLICRRKSDSNGIKPPICDNKPDSIDKKCHFKRKIERIQTAKLTTFVC